jgi:hypothetical protein
VERENVRARLDQEQGEPEPTLEERRQQAKCPKRIASIINLIEPETIHDYFGTTDHEAIWREMNRRQEHRDGVIEWLDAMITTNVSEEVQQMNKRVRVLKVQEAHRTSKEIAVKRFLDKEQSPSCQIDVITVTEHFTKT